MGEGDANAVGLAAVLRQAVAMLQASGCRGCLIWIGSKSETLQPSDLDLACEGLPVACFFEALGRLLRTLPIPVALIDLEDPALPQNFVSGFYRRGSYFMRKTHLMRLQSEIDRCDLPVPDGATLHALDMNHRHNRTNLAVHRYSVEGRRVVYLKGVHRRQPHPCFQSKVSGANHQRRLSER